MRILATRSCPSLESRLGGLLASGGAGEDFSVENVRGGQVWLRAIISDLRQKMGTATGVRRPRRGSANKKDENGGERTTWPLHHRAGKSKHEGQGYGKTGSSLARVHNAQHELNIRCSRSGRRRLRRMPRSARRVGRETRERNEKTTR